MKANQKGFSVVEILVVTVVVGLLGAVGWLVYDRQNSKNDSNASQTNQQTQVAEETKKDVDPYADWKSYCDDKAGLCFKYPADWKMEESSDTYVSVVSPTETARIAYQSNYERDGGIRNVTPIKLVNSSNFAGYSVAGTYSVYLDKPNVVYDLVEGTVEDNGFKVGQATKSLDNPRFDYNGITYKVFGTPLKNATTGADFANETEAKAWFDSADGKIVALILQSFAKK
jgi:prepilin-type N-terminal cleavage/methylation domain-containing protein